MVHSTKLEQKTREKANEIQKQMIDVIDKNNKVTSGHNKLMLWLTGVIVFLTIITLLSNCNKTGRYAIAGGEGGVYLVNTKTSQLWIRTGSGHSLYLGTNENPAHEVIPLKSKNEQKQ